MGRMFDLSICGTDYIFTDSDDKNALKEILHLLRASNLSWCMFSSSLGQAESRDLPEEACGRGQQVEAGLYPQTQSGKLVLD